MDWVDAVAVSHVGDILEKVKIAPPLPLRRLSALEIPEHLQEGGLASVLLDDVEALAGDDEESASEVSSSQLKLLAVLIVRVKT